jgi:DnaJ-class molecular chaperone
MDCYNVLGVHATEKAPAIYKAFRDIDRGLFPERGGPHGTPRFRATRAAYHVLSDTALRQAYDGRPRRVSSQAASLSLLDDFEGSAPSRDEIVDIIRKNFLPAGPSKSETCVDLELWILGPDPIDALGIPTFFPCPSCHGVGSIWCSLCLACDGTGFAMEEERVPLDEGGHEFLVSLIALGIRTLRLHVHRS